MPPPTPPAPYMPQKPPTPPAPKYKSFLEPAPSFPGIDKEFPICVGPPPMMTSQNRKPSQSDRWKGKGTIRRTTGYINPQVDIPTTSMRLNLRRHLPSLITLHTSCGQSMSMPNKLLDILSKAQWVGSTCGIYINGKWVRADRAAERLFNISIWPVCGSPGRWVEKYAHEHNPDPSRSPSLHTTQSKQNHKKIT